MTTIPILEPADEAAAIIDAAVRYVMHRERGHTGDIEQANLFAAVNRYRKVKWDIG